MERPLVTELGGIVAAIPDGVDPTELAACLEGARRRPTTPSQAQLERLAAIASLELARDLTQGPGQAIAEITRVIHPLFPNCDGISVIVYDREADSFVQSGSTVPGQTHGYAATRVRKNGGATRFIVDAGLGLYVRDTARDPFTANKMLDESGSRSYLGLPIVAGGVALGVIYVIGREVGQFDDEDVAFLRLIADRAAIVIRAASEYAEIARMVKQRTLVTRITSALAATDHPNLLVPELLQHAVDALGLDNLALIPARPHRDFPVTLAGSRPVGWATESRPSELRRLLSAELAESSALMCPFDSPYGGRATMVATRSGLPLDQSDRLTLLQVASIISGATKRAVAVEQLRASNESLAQFAHVVSHDLRSPLASIAGFVELVLLLDGDAMSDVGRETAGDAVEVAHRMSDTIQALLDSAQLSVGDVDKVEVDLSILLQRVLTDLVDPIRVLDAVVQADGLPTVWADASSLRVAIQNLVANGLKFTRPGVPPRITVTCNEIAGGIELRVADEGIGVPEADRGRVFKMFERGQVAQAEDAVAGSGIGLSTVSRIVESHGGFVWLEPNEPHGTVAIIQLPNRQDD